MEWALPDPKPFAFEPNASLTVRRLFRHINEFISDGLIVIADVGDSLFGAVELRMSQNTDFISPAYYTLNGVCGASIGWGATQHA